MSRFPWRATVFVAGVTAVSAISIAASVVTGPPQVRVIPVPETSTVPVSRPAPLTGMPTRPPISHGTGVTR